MNTRFASALLLSLMLASTSVLADGRGRSDNAHERSKGYSQRDDRGGDRRERSDRRYERERRDERRYEHREDDRRYESRRDDRRERRDDRGYYGARHYHQGDRIAPRYRDRVYYVTDWHHHHLHRPPHGHVWVQVGGDYVLIALATGIIASIILSH
jgi:Ni/Co efflux regulator RcnB